LQKEAYFSKNEYGLGDFAFTNSNGKVSVYKKVAICPLPAGNDLLSNLGQKVKTLLVFLRVNFHIFETFV